MLTIVKAQMLSKPYIHYMDAKIINVWRSRKLFRYFELAQLAGGGLGRSKPATYLMQAH
jgi:hypothetical protein